MSGVRALGVCLCCETDGSLPETQIQHGEAHKLALNNRATLVEARGSMRDVAFAPSEFGLKLVSQQYEPRAELSRHPVGLDSRRFQASLV